MKFIMIYTNFKDKREANKIVKDLVEKKLIACANYINVEAKYFWKGKFVTKKEVAAYLKTRKENWNKVKAYIEENQSYEVPCIIRMAEVEANDSYASWIQEETK